MRVVRHSARRCRGVKRVDAIQCTGPAHQRSGQRAAHVGVARSVLSTTTQDSVERVDRLAGKPGDWQLAQQRAHVRRITPSSRARVVTSTSTTSRYSSMSRLTKGGVG
jgi:hypothetical protein